jgi:integral membrane protein
MRGFRAVALAEGISFLLLLCVAMPLKYMAGMPIAVKIAGSLHGFLFITYLVTAYMVFTELKWPMKRAPGILLAGVLPFGTFVLERKWLK